MKASLVLRFACAFLKSRWMVVVVSFFILSCAGATYIFSLYSGSIKTSLKYDQQTLDTLAFFKDLGGNVGILSGLLYEVVPPSVVLAVGAGMNLFGYLMIWLAVTKRITKPALWQMYLYICVGANSQTFANTGVMVTCVKSFPKSRGIVIGLLKGFVGLSGAIFTQIYLALYENSASSLILLAGWLPPVVSLLFMPFIRLMTSAPEENERRNFYSFLYLSLILAGFLMLVIIVENGLSFSRAGHRSIGVIVIVLIVLNVGVVVQSELKKFKVMQENKQEKPNLVSHFISKSASVVNGNSSGIKDEYGDKSFDQRKQGVAGEILNPSGNLISGDTLVTPCLVQESEKVASLSRRDTSQTAVHKVSTASSDSEDQCQDRRGITSLERNDVMKTSLQNHIELSSTKSLQGVESYCLPSDHHQQNVSAKIADRKEVLQSNRSVSKWPKRGDDYTIPQALISLDMWILFMVTTCGVGAALTAIDNMGQIGDSLGYSKARIGTFVSLISIWNFLGRVMAGYLSEVFLQKYGFPRPLMQTMVLGLACVAHLLIASGVSGSLYVASVIIGLCFGAQFPILFAVISEIFGLRYVATLYSFGAVSSPLGAYLLSVRVAGYMYDKEARRQSAEMLMLSGNRNETTSTDLICHGKSCFQLTFIIMAIVTVFGSLVSAILVWRTKEFYKQDIYAKFCQENENEGTKSTQD